ncbi:two-component system sensor histidine kinase YesM [Anaerobacterium chartisolvens]|uniref:Two-component system sensor histidine kinase YesM n=1 Tax=Anaerobacterium chartisolvens TaxID=1297424 RepID=A0A369B7P6_9FIRM|nr:sensor histidine kinase [Anaerobacterium chartisolvens]RCX17552.1 two-component system sensor histidine kinase YesM [Anaerobacterium chartisolvens]
MNNRVKRAFKVYKNLSIKKKLLLILNIQIIVPLVLIGFMSYKICSDIIKEKSIEYSQDILSMIQLRFKDYSRNLSVISQDLRYDKRIYDILIRDSINNDPIDDYENADTVTNVLKKVVQSRDEIQSISFLSFTGKNYYFDNNSKKSSIKDIAPYPEISVRAREGKGSVVWYLDCVGKRVENIYLARTIYDQDTFTSEIGLMVILVKKEFLETVYHDLETKNLQNIAIISGNNDLIVSKTSNNEYLAELDLEGKESPWIDKNAGALISHVQIEDPQWKAVTYISLKVLNEEINLLRTWIILVIILSISILSILSIIIALDFINPINRLVKGMGKVQEGQSNVHVEVDREDELGFLGKAFNKMAQEIHHLVNGIYREQITRKEAEIKALQSQINPHFLFNTLESINWMAQLNNVPEISETVSDLSALMEASIGRDDRLITLEDEFSYADKYISLLKRRFEDRIELVKNIDSQVLGIKIPRLLIQPLIENAAYHGVEMCREKGIINLNAYIEGENLVIEVKDNGMGIEKDELEQLNEKLSMDNNTYFKTIASKKNKSIGIENVNRRIKLFYGENYGLEIVSRKGVCTVVIVRIPMQHNQTREGYYVQGANSR